MIRIDVKKRLFASALLEKAAKAKRLAVMTTAMCLKKEAEPYVRWQTGATARSADRSDFAKGLIKYDTPYARYAYYNERSRVTRDVHPLASARWVEVAWGAKRDRLEALFKSRMREALS